MTQAQLSEGAGYAPKTLGQLKSKGEGLEEVYSQLKRVYAEWLNNSTISKAREPEPNLVEISKALRRIENGQYYIRAEIRGYGQYSIMQEVKWDQELFLKAMDKVGKLVGANLSADDLLGKSQD